MAKRRRSRRGSERAARILAESRYPLVYGLSDTTIEAQRIAVAIGDWIGANVDTTTSVCHGPSGMAFQGVGEVTCTLGEVRNRGDLIMFWGSNPAESHPRHFTRYSLMPKGMFVPNGRKDRTCVVVDVRKTKSAKAADLFLQIKPRSDFEALWTLRALAKGIELDPDQVHRDTGQPLTVWQDLMQRMKAARFGVIFFGMGVTMTRGKHANSEAMLALTRDMNRYTRFTCKPNRGHGNVTGADNVVTWRTGFPFGVNLGRGYPRFNPGEYTASDVLARREADAALIVASDPMANFSQPAREHLRSIPTSPWTPKRPRPLAMPPWPFMSVPTGSTCRAPPTAWTTSPSRCGRLSSRRIPATWRSCPDRTPRAAVETAGGSVRGTALAPMTSGTGG
jgi:formylmethanofuran dehydrogenase subunit B